MLELSHFSTPPRLLLEVEISHGKLFVLWQDTRADQSGYYIIHPAAQRLESTRDAVKQWILSEVT